MSGCAGGGNRFSPVALPFRMPFWCCDIAPGDDFALGGDVALLIAKTPKRPFLLYPALSSWSRDSPD